MMGTSNGGPVKAILLSPLSLRVRLILAIGLILLASLLAGGLIAWRHAARSVATEMAAALAVGAQNVGSALEDLPRTSDSRRGLARLIDAFDGDRHLRARLVDARGGTLAASTAAAPDRAVPAWFAAALDVPAVTRRIALPAGLDAVAVTLEADARNEIGEVWSEFRDIMLILLAFCGLTFGFVYWSIGLALRPLAALSEGFRAVGLGAYGARARLAGPPEVAALAAGFNRMAADLERLERNNARLNAQLLTLQEEERADLARDLHDEVGPFLFAVGIDAGAILRLAPPEAEELRARVGSIQEAVGHMQRQVRAILGRLRPAALPEIGLAQATANLAAFWRHRHPGLAISLALPEDAAGFGEAREAALYRLIQESLSNAVRHGRPSRIEVIVTHEADGSLSARIADDGTGLGGAGRAPGYGLAGMRERVAALGGSLRLEDGPGGRGAVVTACLPAQPELAPAAP